MRWVDGQLQITSHLGQAVRVNAGGEAACYRYDVSTGAFRAAVFSPDGSVRLLPGSARNVASEAASGINDHGWVVGTINPADGELRAVLWRDGSRVDLHPPASVGSHAEAINNLGVVAGDAGWQDGSQLRSRPCLWIEGRHYDLGASLTTPVALHHVVEINDAGVIAAQGVNPATGAFQAVRLHPSTYAPSGASVADAPTWRSRGPPDLR